MPVVTDLKNLYPLGFLTSKVGIEEGLGTPIVTILPGTTYDPVSRNVTFKFSDGRTVVYKDIPLEDWLMAKFSAGI